MARYRKIDVRIWNDEKFQEIWNARWESPSRVPRSYPFPFEPLPERERECLVRRHRFRKIRKRISAEVLRRFKNRCVGCGASECDLILDHVIPICWGGTNDLENFQPLCQSCNSKKCGQLPLPPRKSQR